MKSTPVKINHTILMADDDPDDQEILKIAIQAFSHKIKLECVNDGFELLEFLKHNPEPDLILLDINMPKKKRQGGFI